MTTETEKLNVIGHRTNRIDGPLKVTGTAKYASDHQFPGMLYAVAVGATIANGQIQSIDASKALKMPGVVGVYHKDNIAKIFNLPPSKGFLDMVIDERRPPLSDNTVQYYGQIIAVAVAHTFEQACAAADAVEVKYDSKTPKVDSNLLADAKLKVEYQRGDALAAYEKAKHKLDLTYRVPPEHHSTIELHASVATFDGHSFTLYETTQAVVNFRDVLAGYLGVEPDKVRVITRFLGSGFGGKLWPWSQSAVAATLARQLGKPIKLVMSRKMVFQAGGHRPAVEQRVLMGADDAGKLVSLQHDFANHRSILDEYKENCDECTKYFYSCPNVLTRFASVQRNIGSPTSMRGPGAVPGLFATESALDELAIKLKIDPVQLRVINEPSKDESLNIPFATRRLLECYELGAEKFGWSQRNAAIGSMKKNGTILGWGTAGAGWIAERFPAEVSVELRDDGSIRVLSATQDIGTGTYTVLAQMAAEEFNVPLSTIDVVIGDSSLPAGPISGGSMVTGSMIPAVSEACGKAKEALLNAAVKTADSPFHGAKEKDLVFANGKIRKSEQSDTEGIPFHQFLKKYNFKMVSGKGSSGSTFGAKASVSRHAYGAHFVEVGWQKDIARLRVNRVVTVIDSGKILNPQAARNQVEGAVVMGIGMALFEQGHYEPTKGALLNSSLADYIVPVHADMPDLEVQFLETPNKELNEYGAKGVGEVGLAGVAAAIANAVHHATGKRVRDLPISIEDLLTVT